MLNSFKSLFLSAMLMATGVAVAQEQPVAQSDLSTGEEVQTQPEIISETFGDWTVNCEINEAGERCQMFQLLRDSNDNPVIEINLFKVNNQEQVFAGATIMAPLETLLGPQMTIAVDEALAKRYPFAFCVQSGCVARVGLTEDDINSYKRGNAATVTIVPVVAPDRTVTVPMSLTGFTKAFERISQS